MATVFNIQQNFSGGTVTGKASGRVDIPQFINSLKSSTNMVTTKYGSIASRPGTKFIATSAAAASGRLITFKYADNIGYAVEFGTGKIRFFKDKALVTDATDFSNGSFTSNITGWSNTSSGTGSAAWNAGGYMDVIGNGAGNEGMATATLNYIGIATYTVTVTVGTTAVKYRVGTTSGGSEITSGTLTTGANKTFTFTPTTAGTVYVSFRQEGSATSTIDSVSMDSPIYTLDSPYAVADLDDLHVTQSFDVMYLVHKNYAPRKLVRYGNDDWALQTVTFKDGPYLDVNSTTTTVTPGAITGSGITLTFSSTTGINNNQGFTSSDVGRTIRIKSGPDDSDALSYSGDGTRTTFPIPFSYSGDSQVAVYAQAATGAFTLKTNPADYTINSLGQVVMGSAPAAGTYLVIQRPNTGTGRWGWATITSVTNSTTVVVTISDSWHGTNATTIWRLGAWYTSNYPSTITFHEQRLYFGGQGRWIWGSVLGDYENFQPDDSDRKGVPDVTSAVYFQLASQEGNEIQSITSQQGLAVLSNGDLTGLFTDIGGVMSAVTPPSPVKNAEVSAGKIQPVVIHKAVVHVSSLKNSVSSLAFDYGRFGYVPQELSTFAENLFTESPIKAMTYQSLPNKILWFVRADGAMISFTYLPELGVQAFMKHTLGGTNAVVLSATSVPSGESNDHLYLLVSRTINGSTARHIEVLENFYDAGDITTSSYFLDDCIHYNSSATATITGLDHLEGQVVRVITEDGMHPNRTVSGGSITLDASYENVIVGLYSNRTAETHPLQINTGKGSGRGSPKSLYEVHLEFYETCSASVGSSSSNVKEIIFTGTTSTGTNDLILYTGTKKVQLATEYSETIQVYVKQVDPLPLTINSIIAKFDLVGK